MPLQSFVNGSTPLIGATWLNQVDVLLVTVFSNATTPALAMTALGATATGVSLFTAANQAAALTVLGATTVGVLSLQAANEAAGRTAIGAAALAGLSTQDWAAKNITADKITFSAGTVTLAPIYKTAGTNLTTPAAGAEEYDGKVFYDTPNASNRAIRWDTHLTALSADFVGTNVATAQPFFDTAQDTITLPSATSYMFEAVISMSRAAGTTSHTIGILFGGTATFLSIAYLIESTTTVGNVLGAGSKIFATVATSTVATAANTDATENNTFVLKGIMRIDVTGTVIPQFIYSVAPGGVPTIRKNSYFKLTPLGNGTVTTVGNWS